MNLADLSEDDSAAHRLAAHLVFGSWSFFGFWSLVFGVSAEVSPTFNHTRSIRELPGQSNLRRLG
jgi:hypothetical protein